MLEFKDQSVHLNPASIQVHVQLSRGHAESVSPCGRLFKTDLLPKHHFKGSVVDKIPCRNSHQAHVRMNRSNSLLLLSWASGSGQHPSKVSQRE